MRLPRRIFTPVMAVTILSVVLFNLASHYLANLVTRRILSNRTIVVDTSSFEVGSHWRPERSDPETWVGYQYPGWPSDSNFDTYQLVRPQEHTILSDMSCVDISGAEVLIIVQSAPDFFQRRNDIRQSWMTFLQNYTMVKAIFVYGLSKVTEVNELLVPEEVTTYCDVVQFDYIDSYQNITLDTLNAVKLALGWDWKGLEPDFLGIADDDSFINVPALMTMLRNDKHNKDSRYLLGERFDDMIIENDCSHPSTTKCFIPGYIYNKDIIPNHFSGGFYILPWGTLQCLFATGLSMSFHPINDMFLTGFAAQACGYFRMDESRIRNGPKFFRRITENDILVHKTKFFDLLITTYVNQRWNFLDKVVTGYFIEEQDDGSWVKFECIDGRCIENESLILNLWALLYPEEIADALNIHGIPGKDPSHVYFQAKDFEKFKQNRTNR